MVVLLFLKTVHFGHPEEEYQYNPHNLSENWEILEVIRARQV